MEYAAVAAAAASLLTALISAGQEGEAQALRKQMAAQYGPEILPHLDEAVAVQMQGTSIQAEDPRLRNAQLDAMAQLQNVYATGGMTEADKAAMQLAQDAVQQRVNASGREAAQAMAQRGGGNAGLGYALNVGAQQAGANALGQQALQSQVDARARALRALEASAGLAGNIRGDDLSFNQTRGGAQDRINMFNAQSQADAQRYNLNLAQQRFDNEMLLRQQRNAANSGVAAGYERGADAARQTGAGVSNALLTYGMWGDEKKKGSK